MHACMYVCMYACTGTHTYRCACTFAHIYLVYDDGGDVAAAADDDDDDDDAAAALTGPYGPEAHSL